MLKLLEYNPHLAINQKINTKQKQEQTKVDEERFRKYLLT